MADSPAQLKLAGRMTTTLLVTVADFFSRPLRFEHAGEFVG